VPTPRDVVRLAKIQREAEGYLELDLPQQAIEALGRLGEPSQLDAHGQYLLGEALRMMKRYGEALAPLRKAAKGDPDNLHVYFALGWCYKRIGRVDRAITALERALKKAPREPLVHYNLACYWSLSGNKQRALRFLSQALEIDPDYRLLVDDEADFDALRFDPDFQALCDGAGAVE